MKKVFLIIKYIVILIFLYLLVRGLFDYFGHTFSWRFNFYALFPLLAAILNFYVIVHISFANKIPIAVRTWFSLVLLSLGIWGLVEFFQFTILAPEYFIFFTILAIILSLLTVVFLLIFTIIYTKKSDFFYSFSNILLLILPPVFFIVILIVSDQIIIKNPGVVYSAVWGHNLPSGQLFPLLIFVESIYLISSLALLVLRRLKAQLLVEKKQLTLFIVAISFPIFFGLLTNGLLPILGYSLIPTATTSSTIMSLIILYAISKYKLFYVNPLTFAHVILDHMASMVCVIDNSGRIEYVNRQLEIMTGYKHEELLGKFFVDICSNYQQEDLLWLISQQNPKERPYIFEFVIKSRQGKKIEVGGVFAPIKNSKGMVSGYVGVLADISQLKETERKLKGKIEEIEKLNRLMVGRELKMVKMKKEIANLKKMHKKQNK